MEVDIIPKKEPKLVNLVTLLVTNVAPEHQVIVTNVSLLTIFPKEFVSQPAQMEVMEIRTTENVPVVPTTLITVILVQVQQHVLIVKELIPCIMETVKTHVPTHTTATTEFAKHVTQPVLLVTTENITDV